MVSLTAAATARACDALRKQLADVDPLVAGLATWLGVTGIAGGHPQPDSGLWLTRDVALAGVLEAAGQTGPRPFEEGLAALRSRTFFAPHNPGGFESDPLAILAVAIGIHHLGDSDAAAWIRKLAERAATGEVEAWRVALLHAAAALACDEVPRENLPLELLAALAGKGVPGCDRPADRTLRTACLVRGDGPAERSLFRLAALVTQGAPRTTGRRRSAVALPAVRTDVGIITIKEEEFAAVLRQFAPTTQVRGARRNYEVAELQTAHGSTRVAITRCVQQGNAHAQMAASDLLEDLSPAFVVVVGIGGGRPTSDLTLGDVVISSFVHDLTLEDTGSDGTSRFSALGGPLDPEAARVVSHLQALIPRMKDWTGTLHAARPQLDVTCTTENAAWNELLDEAFTHHRASGRSSPIVRAERIASSDRLVKDPDLLTQWTSVLKGIMVVEMESAGVYVFCHNKRVPYLAIRGISDIVGAKRDERWTAYACETAAAFARSLIETGVFAKQS
ncbi:MAG: hypothetical protein ABIT01_00240 [Thermoanaerobaculia bacterium]